MKVTRRHVLAGVAAVAAAGAAGGAAVVGAWWRQDVGAGLAVLSEEEAGLFDAIAEAAWPSGGDPAIGGRDAGAARYLDALLVGMPATQRDLLRLSLHAVDALSLPTHGAHFHTLPAAEAQDALSAWLAHPRAELRSLVQSLHILSGMAWTSHPDVAARLVPLFGCGYGRGEPI